MTAYRMLADSKLEPKATAGTIVYDCLGYDYGCSADDTRHTGVVHKAMTLKANGDYPFFTVPVTDLVQVNSDEEPPLSPMPEIGSGDE